jgi:hypothetical protein
MAEHAKYILATGATGWLTVAGGYHPPWGTAAKQFLSACSDALIIDTPDDTKTIGQSRRREKESVP